MVVLEMMLRRVSCKITASNCRSVAGTKISLPGHSPRKQTTLEYLSKCKALDDLSSMDSAE